MIIQRTIRLAVPVETAWKTLQKPSHLARISSPVTGVSISPADREWRVNKTYHLNIRMFSFLPWGLQEVCFTRIDPQTFRMETSEKGGPIKFWRHEMQLQPESESGCLYTDRIELEAGFLTLPLGLFARFLYGHRQRKWQRLSRKRSAGISPESLPGALPA